MLHYNQKRICFKKNCKFEINSFEMAENSTKKQKKIEKQIFFEKEKKKETNEI
jgi:hypothetical protein